MTAMVTPESESSVTGAFARLAGLRATGNDTPELLDAADQACTIMLKSKDAGLILARDDNVLQVTASASERSDLIQAIQLNATESPCTDYFATGEVVTIADIERLDRWPAFRNLAVSHGFRSVHTVPLRLRPQTIGPLNPFREQPSRLDRAEARLAQALAEIAATGILQNRNHRQLHEASHKVVTQQINLYGRRPDKPTLLASAPRRAIDEP